MPDYLSAELSGTTGAAGATLTVAPSGHKPVATVYQSNLKRLRATFTLSTPAAGLADTLVIGFLPAGSTFAFGKLTSSVSLGTSTVAIGTTGATGRYRAAAVFTAVDTPTDFGPATQIGLAAPLAAEERVFITIGVAALPTAGTVVVDIYYSQPN